MYCRPLRKYLSVHVQADWPSLPRYQLSMSRPHRLVVFSLIMQPDIDCSIINDTAMLSPATDQDAMCEYICEAVYGIRLSFYFIIICFQKLSTNLQVMVVFPFPQLCARWIKWIPWNSVNGDSCIAPTHSIVIPLSLGQDKPFWAGHLNSLWSTRVKDKSLVRSGGGWEWQVRLDGQDRQHTSQFVPFRFLSRKPSLFGEVKSDAATGFTFISPKQIKYNKNWG